MHVKQFTPRRFIQVCLFYLLLLWLGLLLLLGSAVCLPLLATRRTFRKPLVQELISAVFRLFLASCVGCGLMELDLRALDALNGRTRLLLVANHPSMIDVFLVLSRVRRVTCLMKASIGTNLFLAVGAYLAGYVSNRSSERLLREAVAALRSGDLLLAFPEGTRTTRQPLNPIKPGFAVIARRAQAPLQPILLLTNSPYLSKGWKIWRPPQFPVRYQARLGADLSTSVPSCETVEQLQNYYLHAMRCSIDPNLTL
jgi:1-acyl-sn-glycerol-3-phosphate acyltransferase